MDVVVSERTQTNSQASAVGYLCGRPELISTDAFKEETLRINRKWTPVLRKTMLDGNRLGRTTAMKALITISLLVDLQILKPQQFISGVFMHQTRLNVTLRISLGTFGWLNL